MTNQHASSHFPKPICFLVGWIDALYLGIGMIWSQRDPGVNYGSYLQWRKRRSHFDWNLFHEDESHSQEKRSWPSGWASFAWLRLRMPMRLRRQAEKCRYRHGSPQHASRRWFRWRDLLGQRHTKTRTEPVAWFIPSWKADYSPEGRQKKNPHSFRTALDPELLLLSRLGMPMKTESGDDQLLVIGDRRGGGWR